MVLNLNYPQQIIVKEKLNFGIGRLHQCYPFGYIEFCQRENAAFSNIPLIYHSLLPKSTNKMIVAEFGALIHGYLNSNQCKYLEFIVLCAVLKELLKSIKMLHSQLLGKIIFLDSLDHRYIQESSEENDCNIFSTFDERSHEGSGHSSTQPFVLIEPVLKLDKPCEGSKETEIIYLENISEDEQNGSKVSEENCLNKISCSQDVSEKRVELDSIEIRQENNSFHENNSFLQPVNDDSIILIPALMPSNLSFNVSVSAETNSISQANSDQDINDKCHEQSISLVLPVQPLDETEATSSNSSKNHVQCRPRNSSIDWKAEDISPQVLERDHINAKATKSTEQLQQKKSLTVTVGEQSNCRASGVFYCNEPNELHSEFLTSEEMVANDECHLNIGTSDGQKKDLVDCNVEYSSHIISAECQLEEVLNLKSNETGNHEPNLTEGEAADMNGEKDNTNGSCLNICEQSEAASGCTEDDCGDSGIISMELQSEELSSAMTRGSDELSETFVNKSNDPNNGLSDDLGKHFSIFDESMSPGRLVIDLNPDCHEFEKVVLSQDSCSNYLQNLLYQEDVEHLQDFSLNQNNTKTVNLNEKLEKRFESSNSPQVSQKKLKRTSNTFQCNVKNNWNVSNTAIEDCSISFDNNLNKILESEKTKESLNIVLEPISSVANVSLQTNKILNSKDDALVIMKNSHLFKIHPSKTIKAKMAFKSEEDKREGKKRKKAEKDSSKCKLLKKENIQASARSNPEIKEMKTHHSKLFQVDDSTTNTSDLCKAVDSQTRNGIKSDTSFKKYRIPRKKLKLDPHEILQKVLPHESNVNKHIHSETKLKVGQMANDNCPQYPKTKGKFNSKEIAKEMESRSEGSASHKFQDSSALEQFKRLVEMNSEYDVTTELIKILQSHQDMTKSTDREKDKYEIENLLSTITENCESLEKSKPSLVNLAFQDCDDDTLIHYGILKLMQRRLVDALAGIDCFLHTRNMFCILPKEFRLPEEENKHETFDGLSLVFRHDAVLDANHLRLLRVLRNNIILLNKNCTKINELEKRNRALSILSSLHQIRFLVLEKLCCNNKGSVISVQQEISIRLSWNQ